MSGVDDLFSSDAPTPIRDRLGRVAWLLAAATPLVLAGPACFTGVPGALIALFCWFTADDELARIETGVLPADRAPRARRLRAAAFSLLGLSAALFALTMALFGAGFYDAALQALVALWNGGDAP